MPDVFGFPVCWAKGLKLWREKQKESYWGPVVCRKKIWVKYVERRVTKKTYSLHFRRHVWRPSQPKKENKEAEEAIKDDDQWVEGYDWVWEDIEPKKIDKLIELELGKLCFWYRPCWEKFKELQLIVYKW